MGHSNQIDIVLVNSPTHDYSRYSRFTASYTRPLGILAIASCLKECGVSLEIIDAEEKQLSIPDIAARVNSIRPKWVAVNAFSPNVRLVSNLVKLIDEEIRVIVGGPHITVATDEEVRELFPDADYCIRGPGELPIRGLVMGEKPKSVQPQIESGTYAKELRSIDVGLLSSSNCMRFGRRSFDMYVSRGCTMDCAFCCGGKTAMGGHARKPRRQIAEEVAALHAAGAEHVRLVDDCAFPSEKTLEEFVSVMGDEGASLTWEANIPYNILSSLDHDTISALRKSGCREVGFGIESADSEIRRKYCKDIDDVVAEDVVRHLVENDILVKNYFIVGFPGEGADGIQATLDYAAKMKERFDGMYQPRVFVLKPYPGTPLWKELVSRGDDPSALLEYCSFEPDIEKYRKHAVSPIAQLSDLAVEELQDKVNDFYNRIESLPSLNSYPEATRLQGKHILMHCRPKDSFHLGNLYMLNYLFRCLSEGARVTVLIIPFDEEIRTQDEREALDKSIRATQSFVRRYLGGEVSAKLEVVSASEFDCDEELKEKCRIAWVKLVNKHQSQVDHPIHRLVRRKGRAWAASNLAFVSKCVASILRFEPDYLAFGKKHEDIYQCFKAVMDEIGEGCGIKPFSRVDFMDMTGENPMDRTDSVQTFIDITDSANTVSCKFSMVREWAEEGLRTWCRDFERAVLDECPPKYRSDNVIDLQQRARGSGELTPYIDLLTAFLREVERDLPQLAMDRQGKISDFDVVWKGDDLASEDDRKMVKTLLRSMFIEISGGEFYINRKYDNGFSGMTVLGARYRLNGRNLQSYILKMGEPKEVEREYSNFEKYIKWRKTFAFVDVTRPSLRYMGKEMVAYNDVTRWIGADLKDGVGGLLDYVKSLQVVSDDFLSALRALFAHHLDAVLYSNNPQENRDGPATMYFLDILPVKYQFEVDSLHGGVLFDSTSDLQEKIIEIEGMVSEVKGDRIIISDEAGLRYAAKAPQGSPVLRQCAEMRWLKVRIAAERSSSGEELYARVYGALRLDVAAETIEILGHRLPNPVKHLDNVVQDEYGSFVVSTTHGDLHPENVLWNAGKYAIIDYGSIRDRAPVVFDAATMAAHFIARYGPIAQAEGADVLALLENHLINGMPAGEGAVGAAAQKFEALMTFFSYEAKCSSAHLDELASWCSRDFYLAALFTRLVSMLKFSSWSPAEFQLIVGAAGVVLKELRGARWQ